MDEVSNGWSARLITALPRLAVSVQPLLPALQQLRQRRLRHPQLLQRSYVWQTPWKFGNKYVNGAFGGWTLSQNFFARSGLPYTW